MVDAAQRVELFDDRYFCGSPFASLILWKIEIGFPFVYNVALRKRLQ